MSSSPHSKRQEEDFEDFEDFDYVEVPTPGPVEDLNSAATALSPTQDGRASSELSKLTSHVLTVSAGEAERLLEALHHLTQCLQEHELLLKNDDLMFKLILFVEEQAHSFLESGADVQPWTSAVEQIQAMFHGYMPTQVYRCLNGVPAHIDKPFDFCHMGRTGKIPFDPMQVHKGIYDAEPDEVEQRNQFDAAVMRFLCVADWAHLVQELPPSENICTCLFERLRLESCNNQ